MFNQANLNMQSKRFNVTLNEKKLVTYNQISKSFQHIFFGYYFIKSLFVT